MIFTPEERRAIFSLVALLLIGEVLGVIDQRRQERPDRELSAWFAQLAWVDDDTTALGGATPSSDSEESRVFGGGEASRGGPDSTDPGVVVQRRSRSSPRPEPLEAAPPGIQTGTRLRIDLASAHDLESLPGIGPSLAARIIEERAHGPFRAATDLLRVKGIGPKKLENLSPFLDFGGNATQGARVESCSLHVGR